MKLGPKFAREILNGHRPALTDESKLEPGQRIDLHRYAQFESQPDQVVITVGKRTKANCWSYVLRDDRPRLLGRQTGYTHRADRAIKARAGEFEPEAVDKQTQRRLTQEAGARESYHHEQEIDRRRKLSIERRLADARKKAAQGRMDISTELRVIERRVARIEQQIEEAA
jgi:hypothetical protein